MSLQTPDRVTTRRTAPPRTVPARPSGTRVRIRRPEAVGAPQPARRAPFTLLVLALVGLGLVGLLVLNTAIAADSFTQRTIGREVATLQLQEQQLRQQVSTAQAPAALAEAAKRLGMVPMGTPGFVIVHPDGSTEVIGAATPALRPAPPGAGPDGRLGTEDDTTAAEGGTR